MTSYGRKTCARSGLRCRRWHRTAVTRALSGLRCHRWHRTAVKHVRAVVYGAVDDMNQNFSKVCDSGFIFGTIASTFWPSFRKNNGWIISYKAKSVIFSHFRTFWGFFSHKRAPGDATGIIFENPGMLHFPPYEVVNSCKISEKYNG